MSVSVPDFWKLLRDSRLLSPQECQLLGGEFASTKGGANQANAKALCQFLLSRKLLTKYQSTVLLAGRSGPFFYGDYKVCERVDQGRLVGLFRAVHVETNHPVLLQFFTGPVTQDARLWASTLGQTRVHCGVVHPHLQRWFETVDLSSFKFLVGEDLAGESLEQRLAFGPLPLPETCRIIRAAALGLTQLHEAGLVHGDIRPRNLWMEPGGNLKVLRDPASAPSSINLLPPEQALARSDYLAPELAQHGKLPDPLTDIYALGCTFFHLLTGRTPFPGGDITQKLGRHAAERIASLDDFGVSPQVSQVVAYLMAKNAGVRFQQASLVADRLASFVDPAQLYIAPTSAVATLSAYESSIANKKSDGASPPGSDLSPEPAAQGAFPTVERRRKRPSPAVSFGPQIGASAMGAAATSEPPAPPPPVDSAEEAAVPIVEINRTPGPIATKSPAALKRRKTPIADFKWKGLDPNDFGWKLIVGGIVTVVMVLGSVTWFALRGGKKSPEPDKVVAEGAKPDNQGSPTTKSGEKQPGKNSKPTKPSETPVSVEQPIGNADVDVPLVQQVVPDDGNLLWASPTSGPPINASGLPLGVQAIIAARPAELLASGEGARVLAALGPTFAAGRTAWETASGVKLEEVEQMLIGLSEGEDGSPRTAVVVHLKSPLPQDELLSRWQNPSPENDESGVSYTARGWSFHIPPSGEGKMFVMGSPGEIKEIMQIKAAPPPMRREIERLRAMSDANRHVTVFVHPNFLFNEQGQKIFSGDREKVRTALTWFLGEGLQGGLASFHFGKDAYAEVRLIARSDKPRYALAEEFRDRLSQVPRLVESYIDELDPPAYWRPVARRFPLAIGFLHKQTRVGVEEEQAVINAVLPGHAAHNLVVASELAIVSTPGAPRAVVNVSEPAKPATPMTIEGVLAAKTSMKFDQESLEFAMQKVATEVKETFPGLPIEFKVVLMGNDMKLDGITKNQSIRDFNEQDKTVAEILTAMVRKANPVTTVKDPSEKDQKLIWVIGPDPDAAEKQCILVTTRAAAEKNKYKLPAAFVPK